MKKIIALLLCLVMVFALVACGGGTDTPAPETNEPADSAPADPNANSSAIEGGSGAAAPSDAKDSISIAVDGDCGSIAAYDITGGGFFPVYICYQESLWENDGSEPGAIYTRLMLAESVDTISDTEYVVHLRQGVTFSNGSAFTASDVIFTFEYVLSRNDRFYYIPTIDMERTVAEDDYTLRIFLTQYDATQLPTLQDIMILDAETFDEEAAKTNPVGTGPYVVTEYVPGSYVKLDARDDWWGGEVAIKHVTFRDIEEPSQKVTALETGEVDAILRCPDDDVAYLQTLDGYNVVQNQALDMTCLYFNCSTDSPLNDQKARWAVAYACDVDNIIAVAHQGLGTKSTGLFSSAASDYIPEIANLHDTYSHGYDLELAKQYAEESGLVGKQVRIMTNGTGVYPVVAQIIQQSLIEIGVDAVVNNYDTATANTMATSETDSWEIFVYYTRNPSGVGVDMVYGTLGKFNWCQTDGLPESDYFRSTGDAILQIADLAEYQAAMKDYLTTCEDFCAYFGLVDVMQTCVAVDSLKNFGYYSFGYHNVADWYFE